MVEKVQGGHLNGMISNSCLVNTGTLIQHSSIGGFGKWDGLLILYHGLIKILEYCSALFEPSSYNLFFTQI